MERVVTVSGDAINHPANFKVLFGTNHHGIKLKQRVDLPITGKSYYRSGPMMGFAMVTLDTPGNKNIFFYSCI